MIVDVSWHKQAWAVLAVAGSMVAGCGPSLTESAPHAERVSDIGEVTMAAATGTDHPVPLVVDYAAAGLTVCGVSDDSGKLVFFGAFGDGRVSDDLDLATLSMSVDLTELPGDDGPVDVIVEADAVSLYFESRGIDTSRLTAGENLQGRLYLRYDAPPRPGIVIEGTFTLVIPAIETDAGEVTSLTLEGGFEVPVIRSCQ